MIAGGIYLGFITETFRRASINWRNNVYATYIFEIGFWVTQTFILFFVLYKVNDGELRVYVFLACLLGFSIYVVLFKTIYKRLLEFMIKVIKVIVKGVIQTIDVLIIQPIKWIVHAAVIVLLYVLNVCLKLLLFILKVLFYPIKLLLYGIKSLLPEKITKKITNMVMFCSTIIYKLKSQMRKLFIKRR